MPSLKINKIYLKQRKPPFMGAFFVIIKIY